jgi:preprotein translocase subunit SecA
MRIFASDRMSLLMQRFGMKEDEAIEAGMLNRAIENAQRKVESHNFDIRKHLLEYDNVANDQRRVVYQQRNELQEAEEIGETIADMRHDVFTEVVNRYIPPGSIDEQWDVPNLEKALEGEFGISPPISEWLEQDESIHEEVLRERILESVDEHFAQKEALTGPEEGPPRQHGLPAPGHRPARLRTEAADAGIQARVVHDVHGPARQHQARGHPNPGPGAGQG